MPVEQPVISTGVLSSAMDEASPHGTGQVKRARARTSSVWAPRPMRPRSSQSALSASPMPSTCVTASTHDPLALGRPQQVDASGPC